MGKYLDIIQKNIKRDDKNTELQCGKREISGKRYYIVKETFEERAAIMEYDGGLNKEEAEKAAVNLITQGHFKREFSCLTDHLNRHHYSTENMSRLQELAYLMDDAWEAIDLPKFKETIEEMLKIPYKKEVI